MAGRGSDARIVSVMIYCGLCDDDLLIYLLIMHIKQRRRTISGGNLNIYQQLIPTNFMICSGNSVLVEIKLTEIRGLKQGRSLSTE